MLDLYDNTYTPVLDDIAEYIHNPLFNELCEAMETKYQTLCKIEFSKCSMEYGWNVKFKKRGKTLCTIYPREHFFTTMIVIGRKEKTLVEEMLSFCSYQLKDIYHSTQEGNGQRWLMIDLEDHNSLYEDVLQLIQIRYESK